MIGVFDSGLGGMQTVQYLRELLPTYTFCYLGDTAYVPYGERSGERIRARTFACLEWLFSQWCVVVIMACNTASAFAIRAWQEQFPDRKVLSVTVPGIEAIIQWGYQKPLLLWTKVTIQTHLYESVREKMYPWYQLVWHLHIGEGRVDALEAGADDKDIRQLIARSELERFRDQIDVIVLGCTHYPLVQSFIATHLPWVPFVDPARTAARQLVAYLYRHEKLDAACVQTGEVRLFVTGKSDHFAQKISLLRSIADPVVQVEIP